MPPLPAEAAGEGRAGVPRASRVLRDGRFLTAGLVRARRPLSLSRQLTLRGTKVHRLTPACPLDPLVSWPQTPWPPEVGGGRYSRAVPCPELPAPSEKRALWSCADLRAGPRILETGSWADAIPVSLLPTLEGRPCPCRPPTSSAAPGLPAGLGPSMPASPVSGHLLGVFLGPSPLFHSWVPSSPRHIFWHPESALGGWQPQRAKNLLDAQRGKEELGPLHRWEDRVLPKATRR